MDTNALSLKTIIATKLYPPETRSTLVARPRLTSRFLQGLNTPLTLVSAPPGFGKTTLIADWLVHRPSESMQQTQLAWLSLDADDNDALRFLAYVIAALSTAVPELDRFTSVVSNTPQPGTAKAVVSAIINELAQDQHSKHRIVLVIDDFHVIETKAVHDILTYLLEHIPPSLRLVILTRADPPLPLARLRARGQLTEIRAHDLRFIQEETIAFLNVVMRLELRAEDVHLLESRTEGWIAGLQLAALSMQGRHDISTFVEAFAGSHHFILEYLVEEVLSRQPDHIQDFLLKTSILDQMCGDLCDALTDNRNGAALLEHLYQLNLFLVPLDSQHHWFRWHHLFVEVLRHQLNRLYPDLSVDLHQRASRWYEREQLIDFAFQHAVKAGYLERAADLLATHWRRMIHYSQVNVLLRSLQTLPDKLVMTNPILAIAYAWVYWLLWQTDAVALWLDCAEQAYVNAPAEHRVSVVTKQYASVPAQIAYLRSYVAGRRGDPHAALTLAKKALSLISIDDSFVSGDVHYCLAVAYRDLGAIGSAIDHFQEARRFMRMEANHIGATGAVFHISRLYQVMGQLHQAADVAHAALDEAQRDSLDHLPLLGAIHFTLAEVLYEWNNLKTAKYHLEKGLELSVGGGHVAAPLIGALMRMRLMQAQNDPAEAQLALEKAVQNANQLGDMRDTNKELAVARVQMWVRQGHVVEAGRWADMVADQLHDAYSYHNELQALVYALVRLAEKKPDDVIAFLSPWLRQAEAHQRNGRVIEMCLLRARAFRMQGDIDAAHAELQEALVLAEPEGYVRTFVDQGEDIARLLRQSGIQDVSLRPYVNKLLQALTVETATHDAPSSPANLVDPLSERELEVLELMASGLSNREIADRILVAVGTVKTHIHHICNKLGVRNRTEAAARARELNLL